MVRAFRDTITYWAPSGYTVEGNRSFAAPVQLTGKWEDEQQLAIDAAGNEFTSMAVAYVDTDVVNEGWLFEGTSVAASPYGVTGAREIRSFRKVKAISSSKVERKAMM